MQKSRISVKLSEASVGVDCSDVTVTFKLSLRPHKQTEGDTESSVRRQTSF